MKKSQPEQMQPKQIKPKQMQNMLDSVILVDEYDHPIGVMDKIEAHRGEAYLHRAISVFLFQKIDDSWYLLMQQRSNQKIVGAGLWANTVCGNVRPGESYQECAYRRLREELCFSYADITSFDLLPVYKFQYSVQCNEEYSEREIDQVFVGVVSGKKMLVSREKIVEKGKKGEQALQVLHTVFPNSHEVARTGWVACDSLQNVVSTADQSIQLFEGGRSRVGVLSQDELAPWFTIMIQNGALQATILNHLEQYSPITIN